MKNLKDFRKIKRFESCIYLEKYENLENLKYLQILKKLEESGDCKKFIKIMKGGHLNNLENLNLE